MDASKHYVSWVFSISICFIWSVLDGILEWIITDGGFGRFSKKNEKKKKNSHKFVKKKNCFEYFTSFFCFSFSRGHVISGIDFFF